MIKGFIVACVVLASAVPVYAEPGDPRFSRNSSQQVTHRGRTFQTEATIVGGRSQACVSAARGRRTCGCELSIKLFGKIIPDLMLAWNWTKKFASTVPGSGVVAVRPGHVLLVQNHVRGTVYQVWDPNSGGGQTRVHERDLAGWRFVNPNSSRVAMR